jgi:spermidine synthase
MTTDRLKLLRSSALGVLALLAAAIGLWLALDSTRQVGDGGERQGRLEEEVRSEYSRMKIRRVGQVRTLWFVRDNGDEVVESMVDMERPHDLLVDYTKYMFTSYLLRPKQEKVLIVGLGGGAMIHFLKHYDPKVKVDVVEIDPAVVKVADKYFGVRSGGNVNIVTKDAFDYLKKTDARYDVIYMDAFLKPAAGKTNPTGVPLHLMTIKFYKEVQTKLQPDGMVVFNINPHETVGEEIKNIREAFPQTYVFQLPNFGGNVVVGSMARKRMDLRELETAATELDRRFQTTYPFRLMVRYLERK